MHGGYIQTTGCLQEDTIVCITAKADQTALAQTAVKLTRWNFFAFPYPLITHIQCMCSWGKSQSMQLYQQCHFIMAPAHVPTQAQLLPVTPVLVLVESHREPRSRWLSVSWWNGRQMQCQAGMQQGPTSPWHRAQPCSSPSLREGQIPMADLQTEQPQGHTHTSCSSVLESCQPHSCPFRGLGLGLDQQPSHWISTELCSSAGTMPAPVRIYQTAKA